MRGSVRKKGNRYYVVLDLGRDENGKRKRKWISGYSSYAEAEKDLNEYVYRVQRNEYADSKNMTVEQYLRDWLEMKKYDVAPTTYAKYGHSINRFIDEIGFLKLEKVTPMVLKKAMFAMMNDGLSNSSVATYYRAVRTAFNEAVELQLLYSSPCAKVKPPRVQDEEVRTLFEPEAKKLLQNIEDHPIRMPIYLALSCGLRRGEALGLRWQDVDEINKVLYIRKNRTLADGKIVTRSPKTNTGRRTVRIPDNLMEQLRKEKLRQKKNKLAIKDYEDSGYVCCWDDGQPFRPDYVTKSFDKILKELGLPDICFHDLRHTYATLQLKNGVNIKVIQEVLGHSNIKVTLALYSHVMPDMQQEAVEKIDSIFV